jgi:uncharacterized membrane protein YbhN (UPF0104 family)
VLEVCLRARPLWFGGGVALYLASQVVSAIRWHRIARAVGFATVRGACIRAYFIGMFFGLAIPSTIGADGARALLLGRDPPGRARALSTVVFDRLVGLATLFAVAVAALLLGPTGALPRSLVAAVTALGSALVLAWAAAPRVARLLPAGARLRRLAEEDLAPLFRDRSLVAAAVALSFGVHGLQIAAQKLLTEAIGLHVTWGFVAIYHPLVALAAAVPLTVGGFGFREAAYAYLLPHAGVAPDDAIALGLLWWAVGALGGLLGGIVYGLGTDRVR